MTPGARASILSFFAIAFAWSWTCWLALPLLNEDFPAAAGVLALTGGFGPSVAAIIVVVYGEGVAGLRRWLKRCLQWRVGWHWVLLAFFFPAVVLGLAAGAHVALGGPLPASPEAGHVLLAVVNFILVFLVGGPPA